MSVVSRNPSISVQNMNKTTSSVGHIWSETSTKSSKIDHPASTSKSPYIREIHTNAARRVERQQQQHLRSRPSLPSSHLSSTLPKGRAVPRTRASGSLSSGFIPGTFSNGASSISALSITGTVEHDELDLGYQGHLSDRTSARRTDVFTVCDVEIQVRSKVTDKSVQADDMADESVLSTVQKENEEIMEENFKLRRLVEDLRFRLTEVSHEKEALEEEMQQMRIDTRLSESSLEKMERDSQTEPVEMDDYAGSNSSSGRRTRDLSPTRTLTPVSLIEDEKEPSVDALFASLDHEIMDYDQENHVTPTQDVGGFGKEDDKALSAKKEALQSLILGHVERHRLLKKVKKQETKNARSVLQAYFRGHIERKRVMYMLREEEM